MSSLNSGLTSERKLLIKTDYVRVEHVSTVSKINESL